MWWQEFHFLRWYWLLFSVAAAVVFWGSMRYRGVLSSWAKVCDENLLNYLLIKGKNQQRRRPFLWAACILLLSAVSFAGPTWQKQDNPTLGVENPVIFILNMSSQMYVKDVAPSRMVRAKYAIKDLLQGLQNAESGLLVYSKEPFVVTPLTDDASLIDNVLDATDMDIMPEDGDRLDRAIDLAVERMKSAGYAKGNIVVVTADIGERFDAALESAAQAQAQGVHVHVVKVSREASEKLKMVADKGNGYYLNYKDALTGLTDHINNIADKELKKNMNLQAVWLDAGYYLFWLPALMLLYYFRRGILLGLAMVLFSSYAHAGWFLNNNQEAMQLFQNKDYAAAEKKFEHKQWRGAAAYKNGNYTQALKDFSEQNDTTSLYNQGNALAKSGKIKDAIAKYEEVLQKDPHFEDARFNLEYLKKQQEQQNQQSEQQKKQQNQDSQDKKPQNQEQNQQSTDEKNQPQQDQNQQQEQGENQQKQQSSQQQDKQRQEQQEQQQSQQDNESAKKENAGKQEQYQPSTNSENEQRDMQASEDETKQQEPSAESDGKSAQQQQQRAAADGQEQNGQDESAEIMQQAQYGDEDENSDQEAKALQTQAGVRSADDEEKIRARSQKFREIKEDKGGLLRSFIQKEYKKNRYKND